MEYKLYMYWNVIEFCGYFLDVVSFLHFNFFKQDSYNTLWAIAYGQRCFMYNFYNIVLNDIDILQNIIGILDVLWEFLRF